jgi:putative ABC transport system permease protein
MTLWSMLSIAFVALMRHRLRTGLTTLGIMIGIAAVLCTVALGEGSAREIERQMADLGDNFVWIEAGGRNVGGVRTGAGGSPTLNAQDMEAIVQHVPAVKACSPQVDSRVQLIYGNQNWSTSYRGVSPEFLEIRKWTVASGAVFTQADVDGQQNVCLLGKTVADILFGDDDPLEQVIRVRNLPFRVIGILGAKGASASGQDQDDTIFIPYTTAQRKIRGITWLDDVMCSTVSPTAADRAEEDMTALLRERHKLIPGEPDDFTIRRPQDAIKLREESARTMGIMLAAIASISLLVGGIGIMNIMLVSVAERTREIGLRMAVGARGLDVQLQFFIEAVILSLGGGVLGVLAGIGSAQVLSNTLEWAMPTSARSIVEATGFAAAAGIVFGFYPARRAAKLDPIEALRIE